MNAPPRPLLVRPSGQPSSEGADRTASARPTPPAAAPGAPGAGELAGRMRLHLGPLAAGQARIVSTRPDWVPRLCADRPASQLPGLLGTVFSLCGHAHRWTAARAVAAARADGPLAGADPVERLRHRVATAREQVLRISHDWPRLLPGAAPVPDAAVLLRACPLWRDDLPLPDRLAALPAWLQQKWLGQPVADWLQAHADAPDTHAARWAARHDSPLARLLQAQRPALQALATPARPWGLPAAGGLTEAGPQPFAALAARMHGPAVDDPAVSFCARPDWQGEHPDTGPWSRRADPLPLAARNAWQRLVARLVEVLRLAGEGGETWLSDGALQLAPGHGLAWLEMARGLLVHSVVLAPGPAEDPRVLQCRVLAPTEWNFHPRGSLAQALQALDPHPAGQTMTDAARRLAVAFDPCVAFDISHPATPLEASPCMN